MNTNNEPPVILFEIPLKNGNTLVAERYTWSGENPSEICVYIRSEHEILQDIAIIRENKDADDEIETLIYADEYNEDYTHRFLINQYMPERDIK